MAHCIVAEADAVLDREFPVLDKGFIRLVDYLGGDERVVQSARVSYGTGTKTWREDSGLIDYLMRNRHTSPFEQVVFTFHVKLPIFVARQWVRHRTARLNEISGRYSVMKDDFYIPAPEDLALQSGDNKQGRSVDALESASAEKIRSGLEAAQKRAYGEYSDLVEGGLARELARINLPLSLYTEWYWQIDLHNLFHFLDLRLDTHAQKEIRLYAQVLFDIAKKVAPRCCASFEEHVLGAVNFSRSEFAELQRRLGMTETPAQKPVTEGRAQGNAPEPLSIKRFEEKLASGKQK
ncbi:MAG: FAD-dependent thymidylate synthase [Spirochaetaceae bacterium]|jgi:thymidylate synthase (FAD)|nr:FAD-dependent thymidylate synthase [Spirochaetaceae bacterium]